MEKLPKDIARFADRIAIMNPIAFADAEAVHISLAEDYNALLSGRADATTHGGYHMRNAGEMGIELWISPDVLWGDFAARIRKRKGQPRYFYNPKSETFIIADRRPRDGVSEEVTRQQYLVTQFELAVAAHAFIGAARREDRDAIEADLASARAELLAELNKDGAS